MIRQLTFSIFIIALVAFVPYSNRDKQSLRKLSWLNGTWVSLSSGMKIYESWKTIGDFEMSGRSYAIKRNDTLVFENISIVSDDSGLYYIPVVKNQNKGEPIRFAMTSQSDSSLIFENPEHDFPQKISYKLISSDSLVAEISATNKGRMKQQTFEMKRVSE